MKNSMCIKCSPLLTHKTKVGKISKILRGKWQHPKFWSSNTIHLQLNYIPTSFTLYIYGDHFLCAVSLRDPNHKPSLPFIMVAAVTNSSSCAFAGLYILTIDEYIAYNNSSRSVKCHARKWQLTINMNTNNFVFICIYM